ncbi:hypothetical protein [Neisseria animaloris]|uniref:hypothetical protein n=1 Tax=Neisseria animaloris TaxID=326522 RepID=UPI000F83123F|nr:hypothetical protein [Neisseria animaloris]
MTNRNKVNLYAVAAFCRLWSVEEGNRGMPILRDGKGEWNDMESCLLYTGLVFGPVLFFQTASSGLLEAV